MSKTKRTMLLAIVSALNYGLAALGGLVLGRVVLTRLGSDYNGLNAVISQFLTVISLAEGGFTTASLVAMFKPYGEEDHAEVNRLYAESSFRFRQIGRYALVFGIVSAGIYAKIIDSNISYGIIVAVLLIALFTAVFNLYYVTKVRILFQVTQSEHVFVGITTVTNLLSQLTMILLVWYTGNIVLARCAPLVFAVLAGVAANRYFFRKNTFVAKTPEWDGIKRIYGTRDVLVSKIVSVIHSSASVLFLSVFANTMLTSVYAVYNSVISVVAYVVNIGFTAPQNALGLVLQQNDKEHARDVAEEIEYLVILVITILFSALGTVLLPFVSVYTHGITDIEYINPLLAVILMLTVYLQLIHIPSGLCINLSGFFAVSRKIQMIALIELVVGGLILGKLFGFYGILSSIMLCNIVLAVLEIGYTHRKIFPRSIKKFLGVVGPHFILMVCLMVVLQPLAEKVIHGYLSFFICGCCVFIVDTVCVILFNLVFFRSQMKKMFRRVVQMFYPM